MKSVLFVCLGNICRSPTAEAVFRKKVVDAGLNSSFHIDSCGTSGNHAGENADFRMLTHAKNRGYDLTSIARGFTRADFKNFDYIVTMDQRNFEDIQKLDTDDAHKEKIIPMIQFCNNQELQGIPDPYYGGEEGFELVLDLLEEGCAALLKSIQTS